MSSQEISRKTPSEYANMGDSYDCTGHIGPLWPDYYAKNRPEWPMYSFERPSGILWNAIAKDLYERGWTDEQIKAWLQSKGPRWALDGELGDKIAQLGKEYARKVDHVR